MEWGRGALSVFRLQRISRREIVDIFSQKKIYAVPQVQLGLHAVLEIFLSQLNVLYTLSERRRQGIGGGNLGDSGVDGRITLR
jgi:hypothetical protein